MQDGTLRTAPNSNSILPGITRGLIFPLAEREGLNIREQPLHREELGRVTEMFLTGTTTEVLPVVRVNGHPVGDGRPGPFTRRLQDAYREAVRVFLTTA